jgi:hypothetical protein
MLISNTFVLAFGLFMGGFLLLIVSVIALVAILFSK